MGGTSWDAALGSELSNSSNMVIRSSYGNHDSMIPVSFTPRTEAESTPQENPSNPALAVAHPTLMATSADFRLVLQQKCTPSRLKPTIRAKDRHLLELLGFTY